MRACPYCAEQIQDAAILCRYCGKSVAPVAPSPRSRSPEAQIFRVVALVLLLIVLGTGLLYAYRAQSPSAQAVSYDRAISEIQNGQVTTVTIAGDMATLDKADGRREMVTDGTNDGGTLQRTVIDYNARSPARQIRIQVEADSRTPAVIGAVLVGALPVILLVVLVVFLARQPGLRRDRR